MLESNASTLSLFARSLLNLVLNPDNNDFKDAHRDARGETIISIDFHDHPDRIGPDFATAAERSRPPDPLQNAAVEATPPGQADGYAQLSPVICRARGTSGRSGALHRRKIARRVTTCRISQRAAYSAGANT